ncbi:unnamed protein product [Menidia menidia]|uniref:(Atlantic silverside) hypothetical protein n=1 Tax=Menidia menidia TaxID=238744 RepID=A0A8S4AET0_9TELE|nr:unnamed protein product [Menidia menidia]
MINELIDNLHPYLEVISEELQRINEEIKRSSLDATYFSVEENITNQFRKYMDILNAKPKFREVKKKLFLEHFEVTGGDKNLHSLFGAVTGDTFSGESLLDVIVNYEEKGRRPVEDFCARLKNLLCVGLIALLGHAALKGYGEEDALLKTWANKMDAVQAKIDAAVRECIVGFPKQAEQDCRRLVRDRAPGLSNQQLADLVVERLRAKYDWVGWSVRVFRSPSGLFANKKDFHCATGKSRFQTQPEADCGSVAQINGNRTRNHRPLPRRTSSLRPEGNRRNTPHAKAPNRDLRAAYAA